MIKRRDPCILLCLVILLFCQVSRAQISTGSNDTTVAIDGSRKISSPVSNSSYIDSLIKSLPALMRSDEKQARKVLAELEKRSLRQGHRHGLVESMFHKAWLSYRHEPADSAIARIDSALQYIKGIEEDSSLVNFYILKGQCYIRKTQFGPALQQFNLALDLCRKRKDLVGQTRTLVSIGWAYMEDGKSTEAIRFFREVLQLNPSPDYESRSLLLCNIAACYNELGNYVAAAGVASEGIEVARKRGNSMQLANGLNILARSYSLRGRTEEAISLLKEAAEVRLRVADPAMLASDYLELARIYQQQNQHPEALHWAVRALDISTEHHISLKQAAAESALAEIYGVLGNHRQAAIYLKKVIAHKDSLSENQYNRAFARMQVEYETQKREAENLQLKKENLEARLYSSQQQRWLLLLGSGLLLAIISAVFVSRLIKSRYRRRLAETRLEDQKARSLAVVEAEENERRRLAGDLHDGVGQLLAATSMHLKKARQGQLPFETVDKLLDRAATEVRAISHQVTPEILLKYGLEKALEQEIDRLNEAFAPIVFNYYPFVESPVLGDLSSLTLYRCFQELSSNIVKHSKAKQVNVSLNAGIDELQLVVEDDGVGFDPMSVSGGLGLANMKSRLDLFDGNLVTDSYPGKGTTSIVTLRRSLISKAGKNDPDSAGR